MAQPRLRDVHSLEDVSYNFQQLLYAVTHIEADQISSAAVGQKATGSAYLPKSGGTIGGITIANGKIIVTNEATNKKIVEISDAGSILVYDENENIVIELDGANQEMKLNGQNVALGIGLTSQTAPTDVIGTAPAAYDQAFLQALIDSNNALRAKLIEVGVYETLLP